MPYWILLAWPVVGVIGGALTYYFCGAYGRGEDMTLKELILTAMMGPVLPIVVVVLAILANFHPTKIIVFHGKRK